MTGPIGAGEAGVGRIDPPHLHPERRALVQEHPVAQRAVDRVVGEAVGYGLLVVEAGIAAQDVEEIARAAEIQHEARGADGERGGCAAGPRRETLIAAVELGAEDIIEEVRQAAAPADLVVEIEQTVVARHRRERPELELMRALRVEARRSAGEHRYRGEDDRERAHRRLIPLEVALRQQFGPRLETPAAASA